MIPDLTGVFAAVRDERMSDALMLIGEILEDNEPEAVVYMAVSLGLMLQQNPNIGLESWAAVVASSENGFDLHADEVYGWDVMLDALNVLEARHASQQGEDSDETAEIVGQYDYRPGSAKQVNAMLTVAGLLLLDMETQMVSFVRGSRTPDETFRAAIRRVRAGVEARDFNAPPGIVSADWNDPA